MQTVDNHGNILEVKNEKVFLKLKDKKIRSIGRLIETDGIKHYQKRVNSNHIFRKNDSWGICYSVLLEFLGSNDIVEYYYPEENILYFMTKLEILEKGDFLFFKKSGFEKQIFVKRSDWHIKI